MSADSGDAASLLRARSAVLVAVGVGATEERCTGGKPVPCGEWPWPAANAQPNAALPCVKLCDRRS